MMINSNMDLVKCFLRDGDGLTLRIKDNVVQFLAVTQKSHPKYRIICVREDS